MHKELGGYLNFVGICLIIDFILVTYLTDCFIFRVKLLLCNSRGTEWHEERKGNGDESKSYNRIMRTCYCLMSTINVTR